MDEPRKSTITWEEIMNLKKDIEAMDETLIPKTTPMDIDVFNDYLTDDMLIRKIHHINDWKFAKVKRVPFKEWKNATQEDVDAIIAELRKPFTVEEVVDQMSKAMNQYVWIENQKHISVKMDDQNTWEFTAEELRQILKGDMSPFDHLESDFNEVTIEEEEQPIMNNVLALRELVNSGVVTVDEARTLLHSATDN